MATRLPVRLRPDDRGRRRHVLRLPPSRHLPRPRPLRTRTARDPLAGEGPLHYPASEEPRRLFPVDAARPEFVQHDGLVDLEQAPPQGLPQDLDLVGLQTIADVRQLLADRSTKALFERVHGCPSARPAPSGAGASSHTPPSGASPRRLEASAV